MPEALGSMVLALTTGTVGLLGASAMAGYCGGGGIGDLALTYGYEKMNTPLMIVMWPPDTMPSLNMTKCPAGIF